MTLGETIRNKRIELNNSQKELASLLGVNYSFICKVEKNEKIISLDKLQKIALFLSLDFNELKILFYRDKIRNLLKDESCELQHKIYSNLNSNNE